MWRIGFVAHRYEQFYAPLLPGLRERGYVEGQNLIVQRRYAAAHAERLQGQVGGQACVTGSAQSKGFPGAFAAMSEQRPDVLIVVQDALTLEYRKGIIDFILKNMLPSMFVGKGWVEEGG